MPFLIIQPRYFQIFIQLVLELDRIDLSVLSEKKQWFTYCDLSVLGNGEAHHCCWYTLQAKSKHIHKCQSDKWPHESFPNKPKVKHSQIQQYNAGNPLQQETHYPCRVRKPTLSASCSEGQIQMDTFRGLRKSVCEISQSKWCKSAYPYNHAVKPDSVAEAGM